MPEILDHLLVWFAVFTGMLTIEGVLWSVAHGPSARENALLYQKELSQPSFLGRAFRFTHKLSTDLFGKKLLSWRAFGWGCAISFATFMIAFALAIVTTPGMSADLFPIDTTNKAFTLASSYTIAASILLTIFGLMFEFSFVVKSRLLLRLIRENMKWYSCLLVMALDFISTYGLFLIITPVFLILFSYAAIFPMKSMVDPSYLSISDSQGNQSEMINISGTPIEMPGNVVMPTTTLVGIYEKLFSRLTSSAFAHVREGFSQYHTVSLSARLADKYSVPWDVYVLHHPAEANPHIWTTDPKTGQRELVPVKIMSVRLSVQANYLLTTMLASASATTLWVGSCVIILFIMRSVRAPRSSYVWLYDNRDYLWSKCIFPTIVGYFVGCAAIVVYHFL